MQIKIDAWCRLLSFNYLILCMVELRAKQSVLGINQSAFLFSKVIWWQRMFDRAMAMLDGSCEPGSWLKDYRVLFAASQLTMRYLLDIRMRLKLMRLYLYQGTGSDSTTLNAIAGQVLLSLGKQQRSARTTCKLLTDIATEKRVTRFRAM